MRIGRSIFLVLFATMSLTLQAIASQPPQPILSEHAAERLNRIEFWQRQTENAYPLVRKSALRNLLSLKAHEALQTISGKLDDRNPEVRAMAAYVLGYLGKDETIKLLAAQVKKDKDPFVKKSARRAIARIKERMEQEEKEAEMTGSVETN